MPKFTAVRSSKGSKKIVEIRDEAGQVVSTSGGNRAERAQAVVVSIWSPSQMRDGVRLNVELRADVAAAESLAAGYRVSRTVRSRHGYDYETKAAQFAEAILIEEAV